MPPFIDSVRFHKDEAGFFMEEIMRYVGSVDKLTACTNSENEKFLNIIGASGWANPHFSKQEYCHY